MIEKGRVFVSDHDGTLTDADQEALHYDEIALAYLVEILGIREEELASMLMEAKIEIRSNPGVYGMKKNGLIVAPAGADHYVFYTVATEMILERLRAEGLRRVVTLPSLEGQWAFLKQFIQTTGAQLGRVGNFYREGARAYIEELSAAGDFVIVTNSSPNTVAAKLQTLLGDRASDLRLVGNAKKYDIDHDWLGFVPSGEVFLPGFPRGVYLQRKTYFDTLSGLVNGDMSRIAVCGDIAELDTLMVDCLECRTALIKGETTSPWELAYYMNGEARRFASPSLGEIAAWLTQK